MVTNTDGTQRWSLQKFTMDALSLSPLAMQRDFTQGKTLDTIVRGKEKIFTQCVNERLQGNLPRIG